MKSSNTYSPNSVNNIIIVIELWNKLNFFFLCGIAFVDFSCVLGYSLPSEIYTDPCFTAFIQVSTQAQKHRGPGIGLCTCLFSLKYSNHLFRNSITVKCDAAVFSSLHFRTL